jgi:RNA polymerase sigma-70 factor, ECF subfamily
MIDCTVRRLDAAMVLGLYRLANAERWALPVAAFTAFLSASAERAFPDQVPSDAQLDRYFRSLHLEDLALACACAEGLDSAWDHFVLNFRPVLYRAADTMSDRDTAREVADSLHAELFGLALREGTRHSHFRYFHGRSSLATWLRAVLSQRYVDAMRRTSRLDPLPLDESPDALISTASPRPLRVLRSLEVLQRVIATVVATLAARDRLRLRAYYAQDLTLAQIGQLLGEHEATVSRNLARTRRRIRAEVEIVLREREGMKDDEVAECFAAALEDAGPLDLSTLLGPEPVSREIRKEIVQDRSK